MAKEDNTPNPIPEEDFDPSQTTYDDDVLYDPDDPLHEQEYIVVIIEKEK